jgi:hypothetical protein
MRRLLSTLSVMSAASLAPTAALIGERVRAAYYGILIADVRVEKSCGARGCAHSLEPLFPTPT